MAQLSPTMEEGKLLEWKVDEGDSVEQGDIVAEIETDKANMDIEALGGGVLRKKLADAGQTIPVGRLIGVIAGPDESIDVLMAQAAAESGAAGGAAGDAADGADGLTGDADAGKDAATRQAAATPAGGGAAAAAARGDPASARAAPDQPGARAPGRIRASPVARRMAAESGIDLASLAGSGPGGRIVKADIEAALASPPRPTAVATAPVTAPSRSPARLEDRVEEASQMRKAIARRLVQSIGPVPHFFLTTEIDMVRALELRAEMNARLADRKIGVNDLLLKTAAEALTRHPAINASWEGDSIRYHGAVHLGIAVAIEGGLITPVLRDADRKGLSEISDEVRDLVARARAKRLAPEEYQGGTFTLSNLGMFDIEQFTAIINPPEAAILAVGSTVRKPVVVDGEVVARERMRVTMSCDHRVIDGATGAAFLGTFKNMLENPLEMLF